MPDISMEYLNERIDELLLAMKGGFEATASKEELQLLSDRVTKIEAALASKGH